MQQRWRELENLFLAASSLALAQQDAFMNCIAPPLREQVQALLTATAAGKPEAVEAPPTGRPLRGIEGRIVGSCCGAYRLLKWLDSTQGDGSIAPGSDDTDREIYLAVRMDLPAASRVAVKLVRCASDNPAVVARFCASRQLLAQLDHPCIARIIDGGSWRGKPYFVMEHPEGLPITTYCDQQGISVADRRVMIARVRSALAHAHEHTVVHGELNAETILLTEDGTPKIEFMQPSNGTPFKDYAALSEIMRELGISREQTWVTGATVTSALPKASPTSAFHHAG